MSRSPSRHKRYSRRCDIVNGSFSSVSKTIHRYSRDVIYSSRNHERNKRRLSSRRSPEEDEQVSFTKHRHRNHSHSRSPRSHHRNVNKHSSRSKEPSFSLSISPDAVQKLNYVNNRKSSETFSPFLSSPRSPNSSFGNSLFDDIQEQPKYPHLQVPPEEIYTPDALYSLQLPSPFHPHLPVYQPKAFIRGHEEEAGDDEVPMDLASSLSLPPRDKVDETANLLPVVIVRDYHHGRPFTPPPQEDEKPNQQPTDDSAIAKEDNAEFSDGSSLTGPSAGIEVSKATRAHNERMRNKLIPAKRITLPPLHLHLSEDGTSPLPPGWQRAPNPAAAEGGEDGGYPYYYYHTKTRVTRWDPPVYPWDADPDDNLIADRPDDDPEAPYNWGCAHRYAVTHEEIEAMYAQYRKKMLERQCMELIHDMGARPDAPQDAQEQSFAIELFSLIHNELRRFRDSRVDLGRITNDEDLHYLTNKLAQEVVPKEIRNLHRAQQANASSLFAATPEVTPSIKDRVTSYVRRYMESKGSHYRRAMAHHQQAR
ncbi:unnamed protein product [Hymenolepis diminuta]|uniref:WW domain-containing protein n=1 Tax=Hymenolepis diminuta TaxID=6216 RepID=A0A564YT26_HYMDI|nr:unnamed protein product [Hymenolepis diminuta]